jgi:catechol 2,3-dioxygenase-like lactoylglutathione lyase family enzyme
MIRIDHLDHLVLTVASIERTCAFYADVLGMTVETFGAGRTALRFGDQKINLHQADRTFEPKALRPTAGSGDLCFIAATALTEVVAHLGACGVAIEQGPVERTGATGPIRSVYIRDPDGNLVEIANPFGAV